MNKKNLCFLTLFSIFYAYSYLLVSNYTDGDQAVYRALYEALASSNFSQILETSYYHVTANDGLSFYILWIGASLGINKDVFISLLNAILLIGLYKLKIKYKIDRLMFFLILTNFYVVVLMTGAERLKFAFIFLIFAEITERKWLKITLSSLSISAHLQSIILISSAVLGEYSQAIIKKIRNKKISFNVFIGLILFFLLISYAAYVKQEDILSKYNSYSSGGIRLYEILQISSLLFFTLFFIKNKTSLLFSLIPLGAAAAVLGGQRVNMIAVIVTILIFWKEGKQNHPVLYAIMIYLSFKSIDFIYNIMLHGNGFYRI